MADPSSTPTTLRVLYVLYDGRAEDDTDDASVYCCARSLKEAKRDKREMFPDACIWAYDEDGDQLINERRVYV